MGTEISTNSGAASLSDAFFGHAHETSSLFSAHVTAIDMSAFAQRNEILMGTLGGSIEGVQLTGAALAKHVAETARRANGGKKKDSVADILAMLDTRIANFERDTAAQYGEDFAENLLADLFEKGLVDKEDVDRINAIQDPEESRREIAMLTMNGLDNGTITMADLEGHPWADGWLDLYEEKADVQAEQASDLAVGNRPTAGALGDHLQEAVTQVMEEAPDEVSKLEDSANGYAEENQVDLASSDAFSSFDVHGLG